MTCRIQCIKYITWTITLNDWLEVEATSLIQNLKKCQTILRYGVDQLKKYIWLVVFAHIVSYE